MVVQSESFDSYGDRRLIAAFQAGDADAFAQIVGVHGRSLAAEARRRLRSSDDAEDAVQETLLRAYLALDRFGGEYRLHAWLSRILTNVCADTGNRRAAEIRLVDRLGPPRDEAPPADEGIDDAEQRRAVKEAVDSLPDSYRMAFVLREIEERSYAEVAEEMGISEANARARVHRARQSLARALRGAVTVLGGFPIPWHLFGLKRLVPHVAGERVPLISPYSSKSRVVLPGTDISSAVPTASQSSVPMLLQVPLSQTSQAVALATSGPLSQNIIASASVVWHAALPVAAALATMAASAAMVGSGAIASGPDTPTPTSNSHVIVAPSTDLASYVGTPVSTAPGTAVGTAVGTAPASGQPSAAAAASSTSVSSALSTTSSANTSSAGGAASTTASDPWGWVADAASGGVGRGDSTSTSGPSGTQAPAQTTSNSASAGATPPVNCPWNGYFQGVPPGAIALPPPEAAGAVPSSYFSSGTFDVGTSGPAFEVTGQGQFGQDANTVTLSALYGVCLPGTGEPELVANLSNPADSAIGQLVLSGALVNSQSDQGETIAEYRGTSVWIDTPNASSTPLVFVAQVTLAQPHNSSTLRVAFFGPALTFTDSPACANSADTTSAGSDSSSGSNSISGSSQTSTSNCDPSTSDPSSSTGGQTNPTSDSAPSSPSQSSTSSSSDPGASVNGSTSSDASPPGTTASSDPVPKEVRIIQ